VARFVDVPDEALLWDLSDSPFCLKARICLQLKGVPFRRVTLTVARRRELKRLNPAGKVPVLVHGTDVIADSSAIARFLEARYPEPSIIPADPALRAYCALVEEWADEALYFVVGAFKWLNPENRAAAIGNTIPELADGWLRPVVARVIVRDQRRRYALWGYSDASLEQLQLRMHENLVTLESLLEGRAYLTGRTPSVADVAAFAQIAWMRRYAEARLLHGVPGVVRWLERLESIPEVAAALPS